MKLLKNVRLSWFFFGYFILFMVLSYKLPKIKFDSSALTLFSVNSFLYGFYLAPLLTAQKSRIEELTRIVRTEASALFTMQLRTKQVDNPLRTQLQDMVIAYVKACDKNHKAGQGEEAYEEFISFCVNYKGSDKEIVDTLLTLLIANQQNRTQKNMMISNIIYSHEWMVLCVLFSITMSFVLLIDTGKYGMLRVVAALLCTGLSMLLMILSKLSTLTHKKARNVWLPYANLLGSNFYRID